MNYWHYVNLIQVYDLYTSVSNVDVPISIDILNKQIRFQVSSIIHFRQKFTTLDPRGVNIITFITLYLKVKL